MVVQREHGQVRPLVTAEVDGEAVPLLVDTGSVWNALSYDFTDRHHLVTLSSSAAVYLADANGEMIELLHIPRVSVQFEGEQEPAQLDFLRAGQLPGITGILAPNSLVRSGWALIIDLGRNELRYQPEDAALKELERGGTKPTRVEYHRCLREGFFDKGHRIVTASVNGVQTELLVDTGASQSVLYRNSPAIPTLLTRVGSKGTASAVNSESASLTLDPVPIVLPGLSVAVPVAVNSNDGVCWDGLLGADAFADCALVWGAGDLWVACPSK
jgi:hypothetical protein